MPEALAGLEAMLPGLWEVAWRALSALAISLPLAIAVGGPLGVLLYQLSDEPPSPLSQAVHALCSLPCVILLLALIPLLGDWLGYRPVALAVAAVPWFARLVACGLRVVPRGLVEASVAMGASPLQIVTRVLVPEARAALVLAVILLAGSLLAYQTITQLAFANDHVRLAVALAILAAQVRLMQVAGDSLARRIRVIPR